MIKLCHIFLVCPMLSVVVLTLSPKKSLKCVAAQKYIKEGKVGISYTKDRIRFKIK